MINCYIWRKWICLGTRCSLCSSSDCRRDYDARLVIRVDYIGAMVCSSTAIVCIRQHARSSRRCLDRPWCCFPRVLLSWATIAATAQSWSRRVSVEGRSDFSPCLFAWLAVAILAALRDLGEVRLGHDQLGVRGRNCLLQAILAFIYAFVGVHRFSGRYCLFTGHGCFWNLDGFLRRDELFVF